MRLNYLLGVLLWGVGLHPSAVRAQAPPMWVYVQGMPISFDECKNRASRALTAEGYGGWRDFGNGWFGSVANRTASVACIQGNGETVAVIHVAGDNGDSSTRLLGLMRSGSGSSPSGTLDPAVWRWESEGGWQGTWTRRGTSNIFDASYQGPGDRRVTTVEEVTREGNNIRVRAISASDGVLCTKAGAFRGGGGRFIEGTGACPGINSGWQWRLTAQ